MKAIATTFASNYSLFQNSKQCPVYAFIQDKSYELVHIISANEFIVNETIPLEW